MLSAALSESENKGNPRVVSGPLPGLFSNVSASARPATDDEIIVWVNGSWPDGTEGDRLVAENRSTGNTFGFSVSAAEDLSIDSGVLVCCSGVTCGGVCRTCPSTTFPAAVAARSFALRWNAANPTDQQGGSP